MTPSSQDVELLLHRGPPLWNRSAFLSSCLRSGLHICNLLQWNALSYRWGFEGWGQNLGLDIRWDSNAVASVSLKALQSSILHPQLAQEPMQQSAQEPWRTLLPAELGSHALCLPTLRSLLRSLLRCSQAGSQHRNPNPGSACIVMAAVASSP